MSRSLEFVELIITSGTYKVCDSMPCTMRPAMLLFLSAVLLICVIHKREFIMHSTIRWLTFKPSTFSVKITVVMWRSTPRLRSFYQKKRNVSHWSTVSELDSFCQKHVIYDVRSFIRLKNTWLLQYLVQTKWTSAPFPLHYNALALFSFYPNLYIKIKLTLPMK